MEEAAIIYSSSRRRKPQQQQQPHVICAATVILLGLIAVSCCIAAEFRRVKDKDMSVDGSLCSMPRRPAFALGVTALACLSLAQILGTTLARAARKKKKKNNNIIKTMTNPMPRNQAVSITLLVLSWLSFGVAAILLGTASSMNNRQPYGRGWMDGECYVVKDGVFVAAALLAALTVLLTTTFIFVTRRDNIRPPRTGPDDERPVVVVAAVVVDKQHLPPPTPPHLVMDR